MFSVVFVSLDVSTCDIDFLKTLVTDIANYVCQLA